MQTTASRKQKRFDHQQTRLLALIIGLVAAVAIIVVVLALTRTGDDADQSSASIVTTQPPFSETLDKGMLSPIVQQQERREVVRREGLESTSVRQWEPSQVARREGLQPLAGSGIPPYPPDDVIVGMEIAIY